MRPLLHPVSQQQVDIEFWHLADGRGWVSDYSASGGPPRAALAPGGPGLCDQFHANPDNLCICKRAEDQHPWVNAPPRAHTPSMTVV